jgi:hypothetical protein
VDVRIVTKATLWIFEMLQYKSQIHPVRTDIIKNSEIWYNSNTKPTHILLVICF